MKLRIIVTRLLPVLLGTLVIYAIALVIIEGNLACAQRKTLFWGSRGGDVVTVQQKLRQWGYYHGFTDGVYGSATYRAVLDFQRRNGLRPDGVVGPRTWAALGYNVPANEITSPAAVNASVSRGAVSTSQDVLLLARVIEGEAADEPLYGKIAVGAVIMNRVKSSAFPNTVAGVIFQPHAFESVTNGHYTRPLTKESIIAARQAMAGYDPTGGATFFWNPAKNVSPWIWGRQIIARIGRHMFAR